MDRLLRLTELWSWLPAFRAVAETEHLPSAAAMLQVGPSSLSRSVRQIEARLGVELFTRAGRHLRRTPAGDRLLAAVRQAMRRIDDGIEQAVGEELHGELRVASVGILAAFAWTPTAARLRQRHPHLRLRLEAGMPAQPVEDLLRGRLDVVLQSVPVAHGEIHCEQILELTRGIYCGPGHPLHGVAEDVLDAAAVQAHEFVAPPGGAGGQDQDGWPDGAVRTVGLVVDQVQVGCDACASGEYLAVLPDRLVARRLPGLRRLPGPVIPPARLFAIRRDGAESALRADRAFLAALGETLQSL